MVLKMFEDLHEEVTKSRGETTEILKELQQVIIKIEDDEKRVNPKFGKKFEKTKEELCILLEMFYNIQMQ